MSRLFLIVFLIVPLSGCATSRGPVEENTTPRVPGEENTTHEFTKEDLERTFSVGFEELFEACMAACKDVGADYYEPLYKMKDKSATISAAAKYRLYGLVLWDRDDYTEVWLFIEDRSTPGSRSPYVEFWAALEAHL